MLKVDLHCHSSVSDGVLAPADVAAHARRAGVDVWALTDHDEVGGTAAARAAALEQGMRFVSGVEISITWANETVHIVGLQIDENNTALKAGLAATRAGRDARGREIAAQLAQAGIADAYEGALAYVGNPDLMSRTHFARFLVDNGHCASVHEVFQRFLREGKPGFVPHRWAGLGQALGWIRQAGGVAVIAHPARYRYTPTEEFALFGEFQAHGGVAVEVTCGSHFPDEVTRYAAMAEEFDLLASRGSDFHAPGESRVELGTLPDLPGRSTPIWSLWADRLSHLPEHELSKV